jgi:hypothetical protein
MLPLDCWTSRRTRRPGNGGCGTWEPFWHCRKYEDGQWVDAQVLSETALRWLCRTLERLVGADRGVGEPDLRRHLRDTLRADLSEHSRYRRRLFQLINLIDEGYLSRWAVAADTARGVSPERLSRAIATHLLDRGYSTGFLHRTFRRLAESGTTTIGDLLDEATRLASASPRQFEVLAPFVVVPRSGELTIFNAGGY